MSSLLEVPHIFDYCDTIYDGILKRGLYAAIEAFDTDIGPLTTQRYSLGLLDLIRGAPSGSQIPIAEATAAVGVYQVVRQ
jgi:hypothetical protein